MRVFLINANIAFFLMILHKQWQRTSTGRQSSGITGIIDKLYQALEFP